MWIKLVISDINKKIEKKTNKSIAKSIYKLNLQTKCIFLL